MNRSFLMNLAGGGPRGVIHSFDDGRIEDTGPLTKKRMETVDDDVAARAAEFLDTHVKDGKPVFLWINFCLKTVHTHVITALVTAKVKTAVALIRPVNDTSGEIGVTFVTQQDAMPKFGHSTGAMQETIFDFPLAAW